MDITLTPVESSTIDAVGYEPAFERLTVRFKLGAVYQYHGITQDHFNALMAAESKGQFFAQTIRNKPAYPHTKLNGPTAPLPVPAPPAPWTELERQLDALDEAERSYPAYCGYEPGVNQEWLITCARDVARAYRASKGLPA